MCGVMSRRIISATFGVRSYLCFIVLVLTGMGLMGQAAKTGVLNDPIALLGRKIESGQVKLEYSESGFGYLPSLLRNLDLNIDSQILVFSKTSFQLTKISPKTPRAIFFNDNGSRS
jgi:hypothetical protein